MYKMWLKSKAVGCMFVSGVSPIVQDVCSLCSQWSRGWSKLSPTCLPSLCLPGTACVPSELTHFAHFGLPQNVPNIFHQHLSVFKMCKMKAIMHVEYQTKLLQILSNFLKSVPALPLEQAASGGVGIQQFAIMPITLHRTVNRLHFYYVHNFAVSYFKSFYGKQCFKLFGDFCWRKCYARQGWTVWMSIFTTIELSPLQTRLCKWVRVTHFHNFPTPLSLKPFSIFISSSLPPSARPSSWL